MSGRQRRRKRKAGIRDNIVDALVELDRLDLGRLQGGEVGNIEARAHGLVEMLRDYYVENLPPRKY